MRATVSPELFLKASVNKGLLSTREKLVVNLVISAAFAVIVAVVVALVYVHPRGIRFHHSFAVADYTKKELLPTVVDSISSLLILRDSAKRGHNGTYTLTMTTGGRVTSTKASDTPPASCESALYKIIDSKLPSLKHVTSQALSKYSANTLLSEVINKSSPARSPVSRVLGEAAALRGDICDGVTDSYLGLLLLLSEADIRVIRRNVVNVSTAEKLRVYMTALGTVRNDPFMSHLGACAADENDGVDLHMRTARKLSSAVCAITDITNVAKNVFPQVRTLYDARKARSILSVFWLFYRPYYDTWTGSVATFSDSVNSIINSSTVNRFVNGLKRHIRSIEGYVFPSERFSSEGPVEEGSVAEGFSGLKPDRTTGGTGESNMDLLKSMASDVLSGQETSVYLGDDGNLHRSEGFFKKLGKALKAFALLPALLIELIKSLPKIFTALITILVIIAKYLPLIVTELVRLFILLLTNPVRAIYRLFVLVFGIVYIVLLNLLSGVLPLCITYVYAILVSTPAFALTSIIAVAMFLPCLAASIGDHLTNGLLRVLARTENHPEAWWYSPGFEAWNVNRRTLISQSTCSTGYSPFFLMCSRRSGCLNTACSASMLMRAYRTGKFRHSLAAVSGHPMLPSEKKGCKHTVLRNSIACQKALFGSKRKINFTRLNGSVIRDMVRALCLTRHHMLPGSELDTTILAKYALHDDSLSHRLVGIVTDAWNQDTVARGYKASTKLLVAIALLIVFALGIKYMEQVRKLKTHVT